MLIIIIYVGRRFRFPTINCYKDQFRPSLLATTTIIRIFHRNYYILIIYIEDNTNIAIPT